ncbi:cyclic nucleotide-binding domain-containing protein [Candidatus Leptofilum sp.]|uniref:cyclic nucleotide-binding domain-containing protein n=1 Tax=Candidatus Leptofilum sp. TaxID=3241576 RepID=UPI003B597564
MSTEQFWHALEDATNPTAYKPRRNPQIVVSQLQSRTETYYVIKEPETKSYLRLGEEDYALWWQMNGRKSIKDLLFYSLRRYQTLPIGHLTALIGELKDGRFLQAPNVKVYDQIEAELAARAPTSRGQKLLRGFLYTEVATSGLDDFFTPLYQRLKLLFWPVGQTLLFLLVLMGGFAFGLSYFGNSFNFAGSGFGVITLIIANVIVIGLHEVAHGLMTKHVGRELDRGGFLLYWGLPAFFVDTRDTWLSPRMDRIKVSWAGPYSGLMIGGLMGVLLLGLTAYDSSLQQSILATFLFQVGFLAYLSVIVNLNPLLELDGYFMLMDWLEMPGLRDRAFQFLRHEAWPRLRETGSLQKFWQSLSRPERIFLLFGILALIYSAFALWLAFTFWEGYVRGFFLGLWDSGQWWGKLAVGLMTAVFILPAVYYLGLYGWNRIQAGLEWLARRQLLARTDVLALLLGLPIILGAPLLFFLLNRLTPTQVNFWQGIFTWLLHIGTGAALIGVARQLPGSRFQWALWSLTAVPFTLALAWISPGTFGRDLALIATAGAIFAAGIVSWFTINHSFLAATDRLLMALFILLGIGTYTGMTYFLGSEVLAVNGRWLATTIICLGSTLGLALMGPLLINFARSRFALPWALFSLAILITPWLQLYPQLDFTLITVWLYAALLYLLLGTLAQFARAEMAETSEPGIFSERQRLISSFNQFMFALFTSYEAIFGQRRLAAIQSQMAALGPLDPDATILELGQHAQRTLLLAVDRLDDLAGTPFTRKAGQAAYDSLDWLDAETLARHVLSETEWGTQLAQGFIQARDKRTELIRQAEIFAGFDQDGIDELLKVLRRWNTRANQTIATAGREAHHFYLIEEGEVGVFHDGVQMATLAAGGYFGNAALAGSGDYQFTYRALTPVTTLVIDRDNFDPLLRADTTLAQQVSSGAQARSLLRQMPLFSSLSPQELASVDARLEPRRIAAGEQFVQQGAARTHLYIVAEGEVEVFVTGEGKERIIGKLGPGEHFGEYALFADTPYHASVRAVVESRLLLLDEPTFDDLVATCERMTHYVEQIGSGRLIATRRRATPAALIS